VRGKRWGVEWRGYGGKIASALTFTSASRTSASSASAFGHFSLRGFDEKSVRSLSSSFTLPNLEACKSFAQIISKAPSFYLQKNAQNRASTKFSPAFVKCLLTSFFRRLNFAPCRLREPQPAGRRGRARRAQTFDFQYLSFEAYFFLLSSCRPLTFDAPWIIMSAHAWGAEVNWCIDYKKEIYGSWFPQDQPTHRWHLPCSTTINQLVLPTLSLLFL
jgi:hypothetical protein